MVTNFGELERKMCHNSACIRDISEMLASNRRFLESHGGTYILAWPTLVVTNEENSLITVFVSSATDCFFYFLVYLWAYDNILFLSFASLHIHFSLYEFASHCLSCKLRK